MARLKFWTTYNEQKKSLYYGSVGKPFICNLNEFRMSLKPVQEASYDAFRIMEIVSMPILFVFVDLNNADPTIVEQSYYLIDKILPEIGEKFFFKLVVTVADNREFIK